MNFAVRLESQSVDLECRESSNVLSEIGEKGSIWTGANESK